MSDRSRGNTSTHLAGNWWGFGGTYTCLFSRDMR